MNDYFYLAVNPDGSSTRHGIVRSGHYLRTIDKRASFYLPLAVMPDGAARSREQLAATRAKKAREIHALQNQLNFLDVADSIYEAELGAAAREADRAKDIELGKAVVDTYRYGPTTFVSDEIYVRVARKARDLIAAENAGAASEDDEDDENYDGDEDY